MKSYRRNQGAAFENHGALIASKTEQLLKYYLRGTMAPQIKSKSVSRILFPDLRFEISNLRSQIRNLKFCDLKSEIGVAIIPLARLLPAGSSDLPEGFRRAAL